MNKYLFQFLILNLIPAISCFNCSSSRKIFCREGFSRGKWQMGDREYNERMGKYFLVVNINMKMKMKSKRGIFRDFKLIFIIKLSRSSVAFFILPPYILTNPSSPFSFYPNQSFISFLLLSKPIHHILPPSILTNPSYPSTFYPNQPFISSPFYSKQSFITFPLLS